MTDELRKFYIRTEPGRNNTELLLHIKNERAHTLMTELLRLGRNHLRLIVNDPDFADQDEGDKETHRMLQTYTPLSRMDTGVVTYVFHGPGDVAKLAALLASSKTALHKLQHLKAKEIVVTRELHIEVVNAMYELCASLLEILKGIISCHEEDEE